MQPFFTNNYPLLGTLLVGLLTWRVMEAVIDIKSHKRLRAGAHRQDSGSYIVLFCLILLGLLLGLLLAFKFPATTISTIPTILYWFAMLLLYAGIALRLYAIIVLGTFFTTTVAVTSQQTVITTGPYRLIRHPSYTGLLMILLGFGFCFTNWLSLFVIILSALLGLAYRIHIEEQALQAQLGQPYQEYMHHTKRLIPFIL